MSNQLHPCLTCDTLTEHDQCAVCNPEAYIYDGSEMNGAKCNNHQCKTPDAIISVSPDPGYCHKCAYLAKNTGYFPNAVTPINTCYGCSIPTTQKFCWHCNHELHCTEC